MHHIQRASKLALSSNDNKGRRNCQWASKMASLSLLHFEQIKKSDSCKGRQKWKKKGFQKCPEIAYSVPFSTKFKVWCKTASFGSVTLWNGELLNKQIFTTLGIKVEQHLWAFWPLKVQMKIVTAIMNHLTWLHNFYA